MRADGNYRRSVEHVDCLSDASHCNDLSSNAPGDSPRMREVRDRILELVRLWTGLTES